jgi:hypothetical protein
VTAEITEAYGTPYARANYYSHNKRQEVVAMSIEFGDARTKPKKPKATVHKNGRLGFNSDASEVLGLTGMETFCLAYDDEEGPYGDLLLIEEVDDCPERSVVDVAKAGGYYYVNLRRFFDRNEVDYERWKIIYDIEEVDTQYGRALRLRRRERPRNEDSEEQTERDD